MSTRFKCPPDAFVKHDDFKLPGANKITTSVGGAGQKLEQKCNNLASRDAPSVLLRDDHIVLLAIDALLALHASFKKWRKYRRTLRALADLDETSVLPATRPCLKPPLNCWVVKGAAAPLPNSMRPSSAT